jgi:hypothetical protein
MSSIKCPNCGLTNFATATTCKRCKESLEARSYPYWSQDGAVEPPKPDWEKLKTDLVVPAETVDLADYGDGRHTIGNILFGIYLVLTTFFTLNSLRFVTSEPIEQLLKLATEPNTKLYLASFEPFYYLMLYGAVVFLLAAIMVLVTLCLKARVFLRWVVIFLVAEFVYFALQAWLVFRMDVELREKHMPQLDVAADQFQWLPALSIICILITFIWFRYFTTSKRARFVFQ